jgi:ankyrin repeat protein
VNDTPNDQLDPQQDFWTHMCTGDLDRVRAALEAGADPNLAEEGQQPALAQAGHAPWHAPYAPQSAVGLVQLLLKHGADPNVRTKTIENRWVGGRPVLTLLVRADDIPSVRALLDAGADVNAAVEGVDSDGKPSPAYRGMTSLHTAAGRGNNEMVILLLERGANPQARDNNRDTPVMCAIANQNNEGARIIQAHIDRDMLRRSAGLDTDNTDGTPRTIESVDGGGTSVANDTRAIITSEQAKRFRLI